MLNNTIEKEICLVFLLEKIAGEREIACSVTQAHTW